MLLNLASHAVCYVLLVASRKWMSVWISASVLVHIVGFSSSWRLMSVMWLSLLPLLLVVVLMSATIVWCLLLILKFWRHSMRVYCWSMMLSQSCCLLSSFSSSLLMLLDWCGPLLLPTGKQSKVSKVLMVVDGVRWFIATIAPSLLLFLSYPQCDGYDDLMSYFLLPLFSRRSCP